MNILLIYDDLDEKRGEYFGESHKNMIHKLNILKSPNIQSLNTMACLDRAIGDYTMNFFKTEPFIFIAYAHGSQDAIYIGNNKYIDISNAYFFTETFFYACTCLTAKELGGHLRAVGCRIFAGYDATLSSLQAECEPIFYECENAFLSHFLTTNHTIQESLTFMYRKYEDMKVHLRDDYGVFAASILEENLKAFQLFCHDEDRTLTKFHFIPTK